MKTATKHEVSVVVDIILHRDPPLNHLISFHSIATLVSCAV